MINIKNSAGRVGVSLCAFRIHRAPEAALWGTAPCMDLTCSPTAFTLTQNKHLRKRREREKKKAPASLFPYVKEEYHWFSAFTCFHIIRIFRNTVSHFCPLVSPAMNVQLEKCIWEGHGAWLYSTKLHEQDVFMFRWVFLKFTVL